VFTETVGAPVRQRDEDRAAPGPVNKTGAGWRWRPSLPDRVLEAVYYRTNPACGAPAPRPGHHAEAALEVSNAGRPGARAFCGRQSSRAEARRTHTRVSLALTALWRSQRRRPPTAHPRVGEASRTPARSSACSSARSCDGRWPAGALPSLTVPNARPDQRGASIAPRRMWLNDLDGRRWRRSCRACHHRTHP
jgi:hypothetical protein